MNPIISKVGGYILVGGLIVMIIIGLLMNTNIIDTDGWLVRYGFTSTAIISIIGAFLFMC